MRFYNFLVMVLYSLLLCLSDAILVEKVPAFVNSDFGNSNTNDLRHITNTAQNLNVEPHKPAHKLSRRRLFENLDVAGRLLSSSPSPSPSASAKQNSAAAIASSTAPPSPSTSPTQGKQSTTPSPKASFEARASPLPSMTRSYSSTRTPSPTSSATPSEFSSRSPTPSPSRQPRPFLQFEVHITKALTVTDFLQDPNIAQAYRASIAARLGVPARQVVLTRLQDAFGADVAVADTDEANYAFLPRQLQQAPASYLSIETRVWAAPPGAPLNHTAAMEMVRAVTNTPTAQLLDSFLTAYGGTLQLAASDFSEVVERFAAVLSNPDAPSASTSPEPGASTISRTMIVGIVGACIVSVVAVGGFCLAAIRALRSTHLSVDARKRFSRKVHPAPRTSPPGPLANSPAAKATSPQGKGDSLPGGKATREPRAARVSLPHLTIVPPDVAVKQTVIINNPAVDVEAIKRQMRDIEDP